jgi:hypothetical protein
VFEEGEVAKSLALKKTTSHAIDPYDFDVLTSLTNLRKVLVVVLQATLI